jgi:hypothetical protein
MDVSYLIAIILKKSFKINKVKWCTPKKIKKKVSFNTIKKLRKLHFGHFTQEGHKFLNQSHKAQLAYKRLQD